MPTENKPLQNKFVRQSLLINNLDKIFRERFPDATSQIYQKGICQAISLGYANQLFFNEDQGSSFLEMMQILGQEGEAGYAKAERYIDQLLESINDHSIDSSARYESRKNLYELFALIENFFLLYAEENPSDAKALYVSNIRDEYYKITGLDDYASCGFLVRSDRQIESFFTPRDVASPFVENGIYELCTHNHSMLVKVDKESCLELFDPNQGWLTEQEVKTFFQNKSNLSKIPGLYKVNQDTYLMIVRALGPIQHEKNPYHQPVVFVTEEQKNTVVAKIQVAQEAFKNQIQSNDSGDINLAGEDGKTALHWAVIRNQKELVKAILAAPGIDVNHADIEGMTALLCAAQEGCREIAIDLLSVPGIDVNHADIEGMTALLCAAQEGYTEIAIDLLSVPGIDVNHVDIEGMTALSWAAQEGCTEVATALLAHGIDINYRDARGMTALSWAVQKNHLKIVEVLSNKQKQIAFDHAVLRRDTRILTELLHKELSWEFIYNQKGKDSIKDFFAVPGLDINLRDKNGITALLYIISYGDIDSVGALLEAGANINLANKHGQTALHLAAIVGNEKCLKLLVENGAIIDLTNKNGKTALHLAVENGHKESISVLLKAGANINLANKYGQTALHLAAIAGNEKSLKLLLESGAVIDMLNKYGQTALHLAAEKGYIESVKALLAADADLDIRDYRGLSALHKAHQYKHKEIVYLLLDIFIQRALHTDSKLSSDFMSLLDNESYTELYSAVQAGHIEKISHMINQHKLYLKLQDSDCTLPLSHDLSISQAGSMGNSIEKETNVIFSRPLKHHNDRHSFHHNPKQSSS